jgi:hypothetical protein
VVVVVRVLSLVIDGVSVSNGFAVARGISEIACGWLWL